MLNLFDDEQKLTYNFKLKMGKSTHQHLSIDQMENKQEY